MITATIAQERSAAFDLYVKKYRSLLDMHRVSFGSPADLPGFMHQLSENRHLAMDFWALTGRLSRREGGDLTDEQMLAVVLESVAGGEVSELDGEVGRAANDLSRLLAGVDIARPGESDQLVRESVPRNDVETLARAQAEKRAEALNPPIDSDRKLSSIAEVEQPTAAAPIASTQAHEVEETIAPVEAESVQQEMSFDRIENRVDEPLEELELEPPAIEEPTWLAKDLNSGFEWDSKRIRLVLEPEPLPAPETESLIGRAELASALIPLQGYSDGSPSRSATVFVVLVLMICGGVFVQQRYGSLLKERYSSFVQERREKVLPIKAALPPPSAVTAPAAPAPAANPTASAGEVSKPMEVAPVVTAPVETTAEPAQAPLVAKSKESAPVHPAPAAAPRVQTKAAAAAEDATEEEDGPITVAPALMARNLESSRVPIYPEAAKLNHVQGRVVVQAIISRDGLVTDAQAIEGDRLLRSAAVDAVRRWRYRPFLYNKEPLEVVTKVNVDFKLNR